MPSFIYLFKFFLIYFFSVFLSLLFMHHIQYSMEYVPSLIPTTRLTQFPHSPSLQNLQFISQSPQPLMVCLPLQFPATDFSSPSSNVLHGIPYAPQVRETIP